MNFPKNNKVEKLTEPIVGYRVWKLKRGYLRSVSLDHHQWPLRKPMRKDEIDHEGIHALKDAAKLRELMGLYAADIAGSVYLWGEVKEFTEGYLAEFAYPKQFWMPEDSDPTIVMQVEDNYGVPVVLRADISKSVTLESNRTAHQLQSMQAQGLMDIYKYAGLQANIGQQAMQQQANSQSFGLGTTGSLGLGGFLYNPFRT